MPAPFSGAPAAQSNPLGRAVSSSERLRRAVEHRDARGCTGKVGSESRDLQGFGPFPLTWALEPCAGLHEHWQDLYSSVLAYLKYQKYFRLVLYLNSHSPMVRYTLPLSER